MSTIDSTTKLALFIFWVIFVASCATTPSPPELETQSDLDVSRIDGVERIKYEKTTSGEGGRSGTLYREFISDPDKSQWYFEGESTGYTMEVDTRGSLVRENDIETGIVEYSSPRGANGMYPTEDEMSQGFGTTWQTVVKSTQGETWDRDCTLGGVKRVSVGDKSLNGIQWRCRTQNRKHTLPSIQELTSVYINGILRYIEYKNCWKHRSAAKTCDAKPGIYDGYKHYKAVDIEN